MFEVLQEGSARKLIIVRSALVVDNRLDSPIELKLEATDETGKFNYHGSQHQNSGTAILGNSGIVSLGKRLEM